ncbi:CRISPR-associated protein Csy3 [Providencia rustigianii]
MPTTGIKLYICGEQVMAKNNDVASVLAFEKKLVPSDGYFYGTCWDNKTQFTPLSLQEKSVRGTISNRLKGTVKNDPLKLNSEVEKANLQKVDACALGINQDTLMHQFTLKVLGGLKSHRHVITPYSSKVMPKLPKRILRKKVSEN